MSASVLLSGTLFKAPEQRQSRNGNSFTTATMKVESGSDAQFWRLFVFSETQQSELLRLQQGDALSVQGVPKFELYKPDGGEPRVSLSLTAEIVLALRQPPKQRTPKPPKDAPAKPVDTRPRAERWAGDGADEFGDEIPF